MKSVRDLTCGIEVLQTAGDDGLQVLALTCDSRSVSRGSCFFAVRGTTADGHDHISQAVAAGAVCVVCERMPEQTADGVCYVVTPDSAEAAGCMASAFYDHPSREMKLIGVTGTNGKTTTATLLYDLFRALGYEAGLISTVVYRIGSRSVESTHTTPDAIRLNAMLREMADSGCEYCFMECSSHAIVQRRIAGLRFAGGIFTNLTHDHLDYHKTFAEYLRAKKMFFDTLPREAFALVNIDDRNGAVMVQNTRAAVHTLSLRTAADYRCKVVEMLPDSMLLRVDGTEVWVRFTGRFNASNLLTVYAAALLSGAERGDVLRVMSTLTPVRGRFEQIAADDGTIVVVDYAHTPDALENVFRTMGELRTEGRQLISVCGCGGDRDRSKRPEMAAIAVKYASTAIFTSDNPRTEKPEDILHDMTCSLPAGSRFMTIIDRAEAIRTAVMLSAPGDMILIAGKGHETYQIIGREKIHFDDREQVLMRLREFGRLL